MNHEQRYYSKDQDIHFRLTTPEEETALWVKAREGDEAAREFLIKNHLLFAVMRAQEQVGNLLPKDEVTSAANFAVMEAFDRFDHTRGFRFTTYLRPFITGAVSQLWRSKFSGGVPDPSIQRGSLPVDGHERRDNFQKENPFSDPTENSADHPGELLDLRQFNRAKLAAALAGLSKKDAELLHLVYFEDQSFADIARVRGVTRSAVQATHGRIIAKLKKKLEAEGVEPE